MKLIMLNTLSLNENYKNIRIGTYLFDALLIRIGLE
jgi:hypothetical protein